MNRSEIPPFLLKLFYQKGGFHRPENFSSPSLQDYILVYTWPDCTLEELTVELAASKPDTLPHPSIGTRLAFQLVCPDLRGTSAMSNPHPKFAIKDLGSVVIGAGGPGAETGRVATGGFGSRGNASDLGLGTLSEARFVVGDYVSCAILPPLADGSVASPATITRDAMMGSRDGRVASGRQSVPARNGSRMSRGDWRDGGGLDVPVGSWKRGEQLPDQDHARRPRARGRW